MLTKEQILQADDLKTEVVEVPEWGGAVCVKTLSGTEIDAYEQACIEGRGRNARVNLQNARARLCARAIVDSKTGRRLFSDPDIIALGRKSGKALDRIYAVAQRLSGRTTEDLDELVKNSGSDQSGDSISS